MALQTAADESPRPRRGRLAFGAAAEDVLRSPGFPGFVDFGVAVLVPSTLPLLALLQVLAPRTLPPEFRSSWLLSVASFWPKVVAFQALSLQICQGTMDMNVHGTAVDGVANEEVLFNCDLFIMQDLTMYTVQQWIWRSHLSHVS